ADARVIDARGKTIMPGILEPFREVNIAGGTPDAPPRAVIVGRRGRGAAPARGGSVNPAFARLAHHLNPLHPTYRAPLRAGFTFLNLVTNGYGQAAVVRVTPGEPDRMMLNPDGVLFTAVTSETTSLDIVRTALETADKAKKGAPVTLPTTPPSPTESTPAPEARGRRGRRGGPGGRPGPGGGAAPVLDAAT